jgi:hypothetical protein
MSTRSPFVQVTSTTTKLMLLLTLATAFANATVINSTSVSGNRLKISGTGFSGTPTVTFNGTKLSIDNSTETQIVATLNPVPSPGTYRLVVKASASSAVSYVEISKIPKVVAQLSLTGQSAPIPERTLLTPRSNGLYRVSAYLTSVFEVGVDSGVYILVNWTDDSGVGQCPDFVDWPCLAVDPTMNSDQPGTPAMAQRVFMVRAVAGKPITYSVVAGPSVVYGLFMTVEQLQ